ncbi:MAG: TlpA family protein disulfide reductase [Planctomycetaceae bacterium]|nr:TlpA family protein disulfide reductase [Planctomycetaceae bacterium]
MRVNERGLRRLIAVALLGLTVFCVGCSNGSVAKEPPAEEVKAAAAPKPEPKPEMFPIPEGTPSELFAFLEGLAQEEPPARDPESMRAFVAKIGNTVVAASDRILAAKPPEGQASEAVQYKLAGLGLLDQAEVAAAKTKRAAMPAELEAAGYGSLVRLVKVDEFIRRFQKLRSAKREEILAFMEDFAKFLEQSPPPAEDAGLAMQFINTLERVLTPEEAAKYYERYGKAFAGQKDEQVAELAAMMIGAARRLHLPGNEMPLEGLTLEGEELKWDQYRGKVVLVDFWATWCGPCIEEMGNILENYEKYHQLGFDVVGINVDQSRGALVSYLKNNPLPWTIVYDEELKKNGREMMATRYGVAAYPTVMLVGKDGKVIGMNIRGPELGERLAELLGEPDPPSAPAAKEPATEKSDEPK